MVGEQVDHFANVVGAQPILGNDVAQESLVGRGPLLEPALEVGEVLLDRSHRFLFVLDEDVDDAVGHLLGHRAEFFGEEESESAALDDRRSAHGDVGTLGRDDDVAHSEHRGVAGEAASGGD